MHGRILGWPILLLVGTVLCAGSTVAWAQPDSAYGWANDSSYAPAETTGAYHADAGLADRLANVEAELAKIKKKDASAKKKAAGRPSVKVGGRIQWDIASFSQNANSIAQIGDQLDGTEFRRARIFLAGDAFHVLDYKIQMDFADTGRTDGGAMLQSTAFKDAYITVKELPLLGHIRLGHFKEPLGLEQLTSAKYITFMERSLADENAFVPGRNCGVMAFDTYWDQRGTWAIGAFVSKMTAEPPVYRSDDGGMAVTMRGTYLPWYDEATDGRGLLHLGVGYSYRDMDDDVVRFNRTLPAISSTRAIRSSTRPIGSRSISRRPWSTARSRSRRNSSVHTFAATAPPTCGSTVATLSSATS
jgi:phosphate-selective porin OprO/OprP